MIWRRRSKSASPAREHGPCRVSDGRVSDESASSFWLAAFKSVQSTGISARSPNGSTTKSCAGKGAGCSPYHKMINQLDLSEEQQAKLALLGKACKTDGCDRASKAKMMGEFKQPLTAAQAETFRGLCEKAGWSCPIDQAPAGDES